MAEVDPNVQGTEPTTAPEPEEKTFTQADVDAMIQKRLERERKKYPGEDELAAFKAWKESQQTEKEKMETLTGERDTARNQLAEVTAQLEQMRREKFLTGKGVPAEDLDYYTFKIAKLVTEEKTFEAAAEEFLKENKPKTTRVDTSASLEKGAKGATTQNETMNALIRGVFK